MEHSHPWSGCRMCHGGGELSTPGDVVLTALPTGRVRFEMVDGGRVAVSWEMTATATESLGAALLEKAHWAQRMMEFNDEGEADG